MSLTESDLDSLRKVMAYVSSQEYAGLSRDIRKRVHDELKRRGIEVKHFGGSGTAWEHALYDDEGPMLWETDGEFNLGGVRLPVQVALGQIDEYVDARVERHVNRQAERMDAQRKRDMVELETLKARYPEKFK